jgi:hypothetical protein
MMFFLKHGYRLIAHDRRGMPTTEADTINADLLDFIKS